MNTRAITAALGFLILCVTGYTQSSPPQVHSDSTAIDIRDGEVYLRKQWILMPDVKPDIYMTPNWPTAKRISFITNRDSISFQVDPGKEYDFIVILRDRDSCFVKISPFKGTAFIPFAKPASQSWKYILTIGLATIFLLGVVSLQRKEIILRILLFLGVLLPIAFWLFLYLAGVLHHNYDHFKLPVSQLGAIGTRSEYFTALGIWFVGLAILGAGYGLITACKRFQLSILPLIPLLVLGFSFCLLSFFPLGTSEHPTVGSIGLVFLLSPILGLILWKTKWSPSLRFISFFSLIFAFLIFLRFVPSLNASFEGLIQRSFHLAWTFWLLGISFVFTRRINR